VEKVGDTMWKAWITRSHIQRMRTERHHFFAPDLSRKADRRRHHCVLHESAATEITQGVTEVLAYGTAVYVVPTQQMQQQQQPER
jgi:hypothetical protein